MSNSPFLRVLIPAMLFLLLVAQQAECRGGGRGGGGGGRGGGRGGVGGIFIFGGGGLGTVGTIIMVIVVIIVIIYCCYCCVKNCGDKEGSGTGYTSGVTIPCYLCLSRIKEDIWESGYHRKVCADKNVTFLSTLPMPYPIKCPKCDKMMKQWPDRGPEFFCEGGHECPCGSGTIVNNGNNRFNCFICDYDLCKGCVQRKIQQDYPPNYGYQTSGTGEGFGNRAPGASALTPAAGDSPWISPTAPPSVPYPHGSGGLPYGLSPSTEGGGFAPPPPSYDVAVTDQKA